MDPMGEAQALIAKDLLGEKGEKLGRISAVYVDAHNGQPEWLVVNMGGLLGGKTAFAPIDQVMRRGDTATVVWDKKHLKGAPRPQTEGVISPLEEEKLRHYYGLEVPPAGASGCKDAALGLPFGRS